MANPNEGKFINIFKLLSEHNFQLNVKDKYKCSKCKNILINACLTACGCQFCRECVNKMLNNGFNECPGNTELCRNEKLSNVTPDLRMNLKISKLKVKCPEEMCRHECQLKEMENHIESCSKKSVQDKMKEYLQTDSYNHWTMLMDLIENLRNEVAQLARTENTDKNEIEKLKEEGRAKDERIQMMSDEINLLRFDTEMWKGQIDIGKENLDEIAGEMNGKIDAIKMEIAGLSRELRNLKTREVIINDSLMSGSEIRSRMDEMKACLDGKIDLTKFTLRIEKIPDIGFAHLSEYFHPRIHRYNMQMEMWNYGFELKIWLHVHPGVHDKSLTWPLEANFTVKITHKSVVGDYKSVTNHCNIDRPTNNSSNHSAAFTFQTEELSIKNLLQCNCCIVECLVDIL